MTAQRGDFDAGTDEEDRTTVMAAMVLLDNATANSLNPIHRKSWDEDRDTVIKRLKEMLA